MDGNGRLQTATQVDAYAIPPSDAPPDQQVGQAVSPLGEIPVGDRRRSAAKSGAVGVGGGVAIDGLE